MAEIGIKQIQLLALAAVEDPDWQAQYRDICRWYAKEFHTPLHEVEGELDRLYVLRHYYEYSFKKLRDSSNEDSQIRYEELKQSLVFENESAEEERIRDEEDDEWERQMLEDIKKNDEEIKNTQKNEKNPPVSSVTETDDIKNLNNPNIEDDIEFTIQGEDGPPDY